MTPGLVSDETIQRGCWFIGVLTCEYTHIDTMKCFVSHHHHVYLYLASLCLRAMQSEQDTRETTLQGFDSRPLGLHLLTEARLLMNPPSLGSVLLLSTVQEILRALCT